MCYVRVSCLVFLSCKIPLLSKKALATGQLAPGQLVRYRGMVQDMQNAEFFNAVMQESPDTPGVCVSSVCVQCVCPVCVSSVCVSSVCVSSVCVCVCVFMSVVWFGLAPRRAVAMVLGQGPTYEDMHD